ncbi:MAG: right-handed parallel beta-helix repeat-containing protein [Verrucomicrobiota bacterium]
MKSPRRPASYCLIFFSVLQHLNAEIVGTKTVTTAGDSGPGSLRAIIASAVNGDTITFDSSLSGATIPLTSGSLTISDLVASIDASQLTSKITISGSGLSRLFSIAGASDITLRNLALRDGRSTNQGGGGILLAEGSLQMFDCVVSNCFATYNGGGINLALGVTATFDRCLIVGNTSTNLGFGGGFFIGGSSATTMRNCVLSGNSNPFGGGIAMANTSPTIVNCTIQGNAGGGIRCDSQSSPQLTNSILWDNYDTSGTTAAQQLKSLNNSLPATSYSLIQGAANSGSFGNGNSVAWGTGNLNGDLTESNPKFVGENYPSSSPETSRDLRLLATSPALNVGNNPANSGTLDVAGASRIQGPTIDLGAYEGGFATFALFYPTTSPAEDDNFNGISNLQEYGMGFNPSSAPISQATPAMSYDDNGLLLTAYQRTNSLDLSPRLQTSTSIDGDWTDVIENLHYTTASASATNPDQIQIVYRLITPSPRRFYRQSFLLAP